jgi:tetratricopeptide (TPR) repeat protein
MIAMRTHISRLALGVALLAVLLGGCTKKQKEVRHLERGKQLLAKKDYSRAMIEFRNALRADETDSEAWYQLGLGYLASGEQKNAAGAFLQATKLDPKHLAAQVKISEMMLASRDPNWLHEVQKRMTDVLAISQDNLDALNTLAVADWKLGDREQSERRLQEGLARFPKDLRTNVSLAQIRIARKDLSGAEEILTKLSQQQPPNALAFVALAELHIFMNRQNEAEQDYQRALQIEPQNAVALLEYGALKMRSGPKDDAEELFKRVSALPDRQYRPMHATFLWQTGRRAEAIDELARLAQADASDRDARTRLVTAYVAAGRKEEAQKVLNATLERRPKDVDALLQRSELYLQAGKLSEAEKDLLQAARFHPANAPAHFLLARLHGARGTTLSQRQELTEALRLEPSMLRARLALSSLLVGTGAAKTALQILDEAPVEQKELAPTIVQRNWALLAVGDKPAFRKGIDDGLAKERTPDLLLQDAISKLDARDVTGARTSLMEALSGSPEDTRALELLARSYIAGKDTSGAVKFGREYAAKRPNSPRIQYWLGQFLASQGEPEGAATAYQAAIAADPAFFPAKLALATLEIGRGKLQEARKRLAELPQENNSVRFLSAHVEQASGNNAAALDLYRKIVEAEPNNALALNNLAYLLSEHAGKSEEALAYAQKAKELQPENAMIDDTLGWVMYRRSLYGNAVKHLESATSKAPNAVRQYHLAMTYFQLGDLKKGQQALSAGLKLDPNAPEAKLALALQAEKSVKP